MKIALFSDTYFPQVNGVVNVVKQMAISLSEQGHNVVVFTVSSEAEKKLNKDTGGKYKVSLLPSMPFYGYQGERVSYFLGSALAKTKRFKPDVIHVHTPFAVGWEGVLCAKTLKIPLVGTHHTFYDHYLKHVKLEKQSWKKLSWKYTAAFYNRCNLVLIPSRALCAELKDRGLVSPAYVLPNAIDTDSFRPLASKDGKAALKKIFGIKDNAIIYMGRVSYEKSIDVAVRAFATVCKKRTDCQMLVVGDGPEKESLIKLAESLEIGDKMIFTSYLFGQDLVQSLQASEIFITASKSENQPVSVLEAMSCGLPIIGVSAAGMPEIIKDGENGFLSKEDNHEDMAEKIRILLDDNDRIEKVSAASRVMAENYSKEKIAKRLIEYYSLAQKTRYEDQSLS